MTIGITHTLLSVPPVVTEHYAGHGCPACKARDERLHFLAQRYAQKKHAARLVGEAFAEGAK